MGEQGQNGGVAAGSFIHRIGLWGERHNEQPRNPLEPHGTHGALKRADCALKSAFFFPRDSRICVFSLASPTLSQHLTLRQTEGLSKPPTC